MSSHHAPQLHNHALRFFAVAVLVLGIGGAAALVLIRMLAPNGFSSAPELPPVFWLSTVLLLAGSISLDRSLQNVRRERQKRFRRNLVLALAAGTTFVSVQSYGVWCLLQKQVASEASTGVNAFVAVFVALHGLHFLVALLCVVFVAVNGFADRYDHEYYWGVTVCAAFWHILCIAWLAILCVFLIAT